MKSIVGVPGVTGNTPELPDRMVTRLKHHHYLNTSNNDDKTNNLGNKKKPRLTRKHGTK